MSDLEPVSLEPQDESPMWESDIEEREAKRKKMFVFGGTAAGVLVGFVGLYFGLSAIAGGLTDDPTPTTPNREAIGGGVDLPAAPPPDPVIVNPIEVASDLDWYAIDSPLGFSQRILASNAGNFYALSTVPGNNFDWPIPKAIYKSTDGENWDIIDLDRNMGTSDMALRGETIYLIGTSPANQGFQEAPEIIVSSSNDDGISWEQTLIPTEAAPPGGAPIEWANVNMKIGASSKGVLAAVNSQFFLDYRALMPAEFVGNSLSYTAVEEGVAVVDHEILDRMYMACEGEMEAAGGDFEQMSPECRQLFEGGDEVGAIGVVTWEELGLPDGGSPFFSEVFLSVDGVNFEKVQSPLNASGDLNTLHASDGGFVIVEWNRGGQRIWFSEDGREWDESPVADFDWITNIGSVEGKTVILGQGRDSSMAAWQNDAGGWDLVDFNAVLGGGIDNRWLSSGAVGPLGVAAVFQTFDERAGREFIQVAVGTSPDTWSVIDLDAIVGGIGEGGYSDWVAVGADQIILRYEIFSRFGEPRSLQVIGAVADEA